MKHRIKLEEVLPMVKVEADCNVDDVKAPKTPSEVSDTEAKQPPAKKPKMEPVSRETRPTKLPPFAFGGLNPSPTLLIQKKSRPVEQQATTIKDETERIGHLDSEAASRREPSTTGLLQAENSNVRQPGQTRDYELEIRTFIATNHLSNPLIGRGTTGVLDQFPFHMQFSHQHRGFPSQIPASIGFPQFGLYPNHYSSPMYPSIPVQIASSRSPAALPMNWNQFAPQRPVSQIRQESSFVSRHSLPYTGLYHQHHTTPAAVTALQTTSDVPPIIKIQRQYVSSSERAKKSDPSKIIEPGDLLDFGRTELRFALRQQTQTETFLSTVEQYHLQHQYSRSKNKPYRRRLLWLMVNEGGFDGDVTRYADASGATRQFVSCFMSHQRGRGNRLAGVVERRPK